MATVNRFVYSLAAGRLQEKAVLGGKGESLVRIEELGLPVPPAFIVSTEICRRFLADGVLPEEVWKEIEAHVAALEEQVGRRLGDPADPLLLSVRSGAAVSMPGMMDTILNVGLTNATVDGFASSLGDSAAALDTFARLVRSYGESVRGLPAEAFSAAAEGGVAAALETVAAVGEPFPQDARRQLRECVEAVLRSWTAPRAARYRRFAGIDDGLGTAVIVQAMVFGNLAERSGTGVAFTRDPATGAPGLYGDFLVRAQGDDVVGGERDVGDLAQLRRLAPEAAEALDEAAAELERRYADLCDLEFTVECGQLWILQARRGERTAPAAVRIALDLVAEGMIDWDEAVSRVPPEALVKILEPVLDPDSPRMVIGRGVAASPGAAVGHAALTPLAAEEFAADGDDVILIRPSTSPWDIAGMIVARGVVTAHGGRTSHAAVVARGMSRPAVCGVGGLVTDEDAARFESCELHAGELVSLDGARGEVYAGAIPLVPPTLDPRVETLLARCDARRRVPVLAVGAAAPWADGVLDPALPVATSVDELADAATGEIVIAPDDPDSAVTLVARAAAAPVHRLLFRVPEVWPSALRELPPGNWTGIAAGEHGRLAARFLAATVEQRHD